MSNEPPRKSTQRRPGLRQSEGLVKDLPASPPLQRRQSHLVAVRRARRRILLLLFLVLGSVLGAAVLSSPLLSVKRLQMTEMESLLPVESAKTLQIVSLKPGTNWLLAPVG